MGQCKADSFDLLHRPWLHCIKARPNKIGQIDCLLLRVSSVYCDLHNCTEARRQYFLIGQTYNRPYLPI